MLGEVAGAEVKRPGGGLFESSQGNVARKRVAGGWRQREEGLRGSW